MTSDAIHAAQICLAWIEELERENARLEAQLASIERLDEKADAASWREQCETARETALREAERADRAEKERDEARANLQAEAFWRNSLSVIERNERYVKERDEVRAKSQAEAFQTTVYGSRAHWLREFAKAADGIPEENTAGFVATALGWEVPPAAFHSKRAELEWWHRANAEWKVREAEALLSAIERHEADKEGGRGA